MGSVVYAPNITDRLRAQRDIFDQIKSDYFITNEVSLGKIKNYTTDNFGTDYFTINLFELGKDHLDLIYTMRNNDVSFGGEDFCLALYMLKNYGLNAEDVSHKKEKILLILSIYDRIDVDSLRPETGLKQIKEMNSVLEVFGPEYMRIIREAEKKPDTPIEFDPILFDHAGKIPGICKEYFRLPANLLYRGAQILPVTRAIWFKRGKPWIDSYDLGRGMELLQKEMEIRSRLIG